MSPEREKILIEDFELAFEDLLVGEEFDMNIAEMNRDPSVVLDQWFIRHLKIFVDQRFEGFLTGIGHRTWRNDFQKVAEGVYPLAQLPTHVHEIAQKMYYHSLD